MLSAPSLGEFPILEWMHHKPFKETSKNAFMKVNLDDGNDGKSAYIRILLVCLIWRKELVDFTLALLKEDLKGLLLLFYRNAHIAERVSEVGSVPVSEYIFA